MEILFLFRGNYSFSADVMNRVKARLPMSNPEVSNRIEFINSDKRNIEKLLKKREEEGDLPTTIYYSTDPYHTKLKPIFKKYPQIRAVEYSSNWSTAYGDIRDTMNKSYKPTTYYGVQYAKFGWCGEITQVTIGLFDQMRFPCFATEDEAKKYAQERLRLKIDAFAEENRDAKRAIREREKFIKAAKEKLEGMNTTKDA